MPKLKLSRRSQRPNMNGSYVYEIIEGEPQLSHPKSNTDARLYGEGEMKDKLIYSRQKVGNWREPFEAEQYTTDYKGKAQIGFVVDLEEHEMLQLGRTLKTIKKADMELDEFAKLKKLSAELNLLDAQTETERSKVHSSPLSQSEPMREQRASTSDIDDADDDEGLDMSTEQKSEEGSEETAETEETVNMEEGVEEEETA